MWEKYYTPLEVADFILKRIKVISPSEALDICVGSWNLLKATNKKWHNIKLTGIDVNQNLDDIAPLNSLFYQMDGRKYAIKCQENNIKYPVILANPPFGRDSTDFSQFSDLPGYRFLNKKSLFRIEVTMILANLSLLAHEGWFGAVVPNTIITGQNMQLLREYIGRNFHVVEIIYLPSDIFTRDIKTAILIIKKTKSQKHTNIVKVSKINNQLNAQLLHKIDYSLISNGYWQSNSRRVASCENVSIFRGSIQNDLLSKNGSVPVLHSTDVMNIRNGIWKPTKFLHSDKLNWNHRRASKGDIIIIRVGRNCGICARLDMDEEDILISDCIFVVRHKNGQENNKLWTLFDSTFQHEKDNIKKGICSTYITKEKIAAYINENYYSKIN